MKMETRAKLGELLRAGWSLRVEPFQPDGALSIAEVMITLTAPFKFKAFGVEDYFRTGETASVWMIEQGLESAINAAHAALARIPPSGTLPTA